MNHWILCALGLALLGIGAELVVRKASQLAALMGIKPIVLGLTVVSIGTSMPELAVGIISSREGSGGMAVGNIAGTNVLNILFIFGLSALIRPLALQMRVLKLDLPAMLVAVVMMTLMAIDGVLTQTDGAILFVTAIFYTVALLMVSRNESRAVKQEFQEAYVEREPPSKRKISEYAAMLVVGIILTVLGADWLVKGAVGIATMLGISATMIGLTIVAVGTSAPELATTILSTIRNERDVAIGNLLGSSIYNILVILGLTCLAAPTGLPVEPALLTADIPMMAGVALLCIPVFITGKRVSRIEGGIFVTIYLFYMLSLLARARA